MPGWDKAPDIKAPENPSGRKPPFPEGLYAAVSSVEDLYIIQSVRPVRAMLAYSRRTAARLLGGGAPLPFTPAEIILVLDPWFPQDMEAVMGEEIKRLLALGYHQFVANNLGHFSLLRSPPAAQASGSRRQPQGAVVIAGPWLYTFNRWSQACITSLGAAAVVPPLENNRQNLERTVDRRSGTLITVFAYPALFRVRTDLGSLYDFGDFAGSQDERFRLINRPEGSLVVPEKPFSIIDKIPFLREAGFSRFILDLSGPPLRKKDYRDLMSAVTKALPLPDTSRFNWKDGFYSVP
jgi:putative protease